MSHQYKAVAAILDTAIASIKSILTAPEDEMHSIRLSQDLTRSRDQLLLLTGSGDLETNTSAVLGPATTIGGIPIAKQRKFTADDMIPSDDKVHNLKKQVEAAVYYFSPEARAEGILANFPDLIIRGVAKKAGLKVSKDEPKEITVEFIEKIKESLAAAGLTAEHSDDNDATDDDDDAEVQEGANETPTGLVTIDKQNPSGERTETFEGVFKKLKELQAAEESSLQDELANQAEAPKAQPKLDDPKQDTKPDPKKKGSK